MQVPIINDQKHQSSCQAGNNCRQKRYTIPDVGVDLNEPQSTQYYIFNPYDEVVNCIFPSEKEKNIYFFNSSSAFWEKYTTAIIKLAALHVVKTGWI